MDFSPNLSLRHVTCVRIVINLWLDQEIRDSLRALLNSNAEGYYDWSPITNKLLDKIDVLSIPSVLKDDMKFFISRIQLDIIHTYRVIVPQDIEDAVDDYLDGLCWTPFGTIDVKKSAQSLVNNEKFCLCLRFELACKFCCEESATILWNQLSADDRENFPGDYVFPFVMYRILRFSDCCFENVREEYYQLLKEDAFEYGLNDLVYLIHCSISIHSNVSFHFFWEKLNEKEKADNIESFAKTAGENFYLLSDTLFFLLSKMNWDQQLRVFSNFPYFVLQHLLTHWLCDDFFIPVVRKMWQFLGGNEYGRLLATTLGMKNNYPWTKWKFQNIFQVLWLESPHHLKKFVIRKCDSLFQYLFVFDESENLEMVFNFATDREKKKVSSRLEEWKKTNANN